MNNMSLEHEKGDIDVVVNTDKFQGQFQTMAIGINTMVGAHIAVKKRAMGVFTEFGQGNFEAPMELLPGKKRFINDTIEQVRANLKALIADANMLSEAAIAGRLATRADASKHLGDFRKIIEGVNNTLDAVIGPLNVAAGYVDRIAKGDIPSKITDNYNGDFNNIKNNINILIDALLFVTETTKKLSQGDLTMQVELRSENDELLKAISFMVAKLNDVMTQLMEAAENVAAGSNEMSLTASSLAQGANEQAASSEEVSSSVEEMASTIQQNSENAVETEKIATSSAIGIAEVNQASQKSLEAIRLIAEKIRVINDIAEKTDILAINAAIEAARAGEHGKGFAVVAAEVRKLAEVSQKAAIDINTLSSSSLKQTEEAGTQMAKILPDIQRTARLVQEIAAASREQSAGAEQIAKAVDQFSQVTQQNSASAEEMSSGSEELSSQAEMLREIVSQFNTGKTIRQVARKSTQLHQFGSNGKINTSNKVKSGSPIILDEFEKTIRPELPVVAQTAYLQNNIQDNYAEQGFSALLAKPFSQERLIEAVKKLII
jgi:methyl-accepting chemotaxis protein